MVDQFQVQPSAFKRRSHSLLNSQPHSAIPTDVVFLLFAGHEVLGKLLIHGTVCPGDLNERGKSCLKTCAICRIRCRDA